MKLCSARLIRGKEEKKMLQFISENIGNMVVCVILLFLVGMAIRTVIRNRKKGHSSCGCDCQGCPYPCGKIYKGRR